MKKLQDYKGFYIEEDEFGVGKVLDSSAKIIKAGLEGGLLSCKMWIEIQTNPLYENLREKLE